jgi:hypothetical protein
VDGVRKEKDRKTETGIQDAMAATEMGWKSIELEENSTARI